MTPLDLLAIRQELREHPNLNSSQSAQLDAFDVHINKMKDKDPFTWNLIENTYLNMKRELREAEKPPITKEPAPVVEEEVPAPTNKDDIYKDAPTLEKLPDTSKRVPPGVAKMAEKIKKQDQEDFDTPEPIETEESPTLADTANELTEEEADNQFKDLTKDVPEEIQKVIDKVKEDNPQIGPGTKMGLLQNALNNLFGDVLLLDQNVNTYNVELVTAANRPHLIVIWNDAEGEDCTKIIYQDTL